MEHLTEFEAECLVFLEKLLSILNPKTDEEKLLQAAAQYLQRRAVFLSRQRSLVSDSFELRLRSPAVAPQVPLAGGSGSAGGEGG